MRSLALSAKIILVSGLVLIAMSLASFAVLYRAQHQLVIQEMDTLLSSETLALSALVDATPQGGFDFEMSSSFITQYRQFRPARFFRFIDPRTGHVLEQSSEALAIGCNTSEDSIIDAHLSDGHEFRVMISHFKPEFDSNATNADQVKPASICLLVGVDEQPYHDIVARSLLSTVPILIFLAILFGAVMRLFVRRLTGDLSRLTSALETTDFSATHAFPLLPEAHTPEVKAVREKLVVLHTQAADVYREMWLFLGRAAHQIKTPVAAMQATLQVLLRKDRSKSELLAGLQDVKLATEQLSVLSRKLISSSRISYQELPNREEIDLNRFLSDLANRFSALGEQYGVRVLLHSQQAVKVWADSGVLEDIFGNLLENAILYSPHNRHEEVAITWDTQPQRVRVLISDRGAGFPKQVIESLFEPFVRGDERAAPGSGLGLSIARKSARLLGGDVSIDRSDKNGSTVAITLPSAGDRETHS